MAEEKVAEAPDKNKKNPMIKVIILVVVLLVVVGASVGGTLALTGFFSKKPADAEQLAEGDPDKGGDHAAGAGHGKSDGHGTKPAAHDSKPAKSGSGAGKADTPQKKALPNAAQARFEKSYMDLDDKKALVANISNSRKVMQVSLSLMTQYDDRVFQNVEKHRAALRSAALDVLRQVAEADIMKPEFRSELAKRLRDKINAELERLENFGGIEEVFFTELVYQ
jgi:flagellar FliL protein